MQVYRKDKETNQQLLRRFNRFVQGLNFLQDVRERREFKKEPNRFAIRQAALRREALRRLKVWY